MINYIWFFIISIGVIFGVITGRGEIVSKAIIASCKSTVDLMIDLVGIMCLWCGVMRIAQESGITDKISRALKPILNFLFKGSAKNDKALGAIVMNMTANMMGLSNAATPFGIKAMQEMQKFNPNKDEATNDMALFLVLNAACIQFIPTSIISIRAACGSQNPGIIILPAIITTGMAALVGITSCKILEKFF